MSSRKKLGTLLITVILIGSLAACDTEDNRFRLDYSIAEDYLIDFNGVTPDTTESGFYIYTVREGNGEFQITARDNILMHYTVRVKGTDRIIESSYVNGSTQPFRISVVNEFGDTRGTAFVEGMIGMKENEQRVLVIPPDEDLEVSFFIDTVIVDYELDSILF